MVNPGSYMDFSSLKGTPKLTGLGNASRVDTLGSSDDIDTVSEKPLLTQRPIDEIASSRQQQPSSLQSCPPSAVPPLRMSPVSESPETEQYHPSQDVHSLATPQAMNLLRGRHHPPRRPESRLPLSIAHVALLRLPSREWKVLFHKACLTVTWPVRATIVAYSCQQPSGS
jgi:hypothetical protein